MAIDTASKRRGVVSVGRNWRGPGVTPTASPGVSWRQTVGRGWLGIAPDEPNPFVPSTERTYVGRALGVRTWTPQSRTLAGFTAMPVLLAGDLEMDELDALSMSELDSLPLSNSISGVRYALAPALRSRTVIPKALKNRTSTGT